MSTFFPAHSPFDEQGAEFADVRQAAALVASGQRLDRAAEDAVARWRFVPARRGESAVEAWVLVPIVFKLKGN